METEKTLEELISQVTAGIRKERAEDDQDWFNQIVGGRNLPTRPVPVFGDPATVNRAVFDLDLTDLLEHLKDNVEGLLPDMQLCPIVPAVLEDGTLRLGIYAQELPSGDGYGKIFKIEKVDGKLKVKGF